MVFAEQLGKKALTVELIFGRGFKSGEFHFASQFHKRHLDFMKTIAELRKARVKAPLQLLQVIVR